MKLHPLCLVHIYESYCNGYVTVDYYLLTLSIALISPFALISATVIPPPTALFEPHKKVTTLNHRFILFYYTNILCAICQEVF